MSTMLIDANTVKGRINRNIYGHFSEHLGRCVYEGLFVGADSDIPNTNGIRDDAVAALKGIKIPVLRWPGGCFADEYHWQDGIGQNRKKMVNTHWGGDVEDNSFGTHEFMELCRQLECEPYICGNLGSGTVREMSEWVEYITCEGSSPMAELRAENGRKEAWRLKYFGVGNENWGCGGNMLADYYANEYRRYQTYCRSYGGNKLYKIACGSGTEDYEWTEILMRKCARFMDAMSIHYYTVPGTWDEKGSATEFSDEKYYLTLAQARKIGKIIDAHLAVMDRHDPGHKVDLVVDEWGTWFDVEKGTHPGYLYQQNTMRDALVAAISLDIFNARCDRIQMANIAQVANVLQSVILTEGKKLILTPTGHVYDLYKRHHDAECLGMFLEGASLSATASRLGEELTLTISNASLDKSEELEIRILGAKAGTVSARILTGKANAHNTFEEPNAVTPAKLEARIENGLVRLELPPCSVAEAVVGIR
ncbi:MAG: alpha-N-arabinofuranosidase [Clostridiales bacterium]|nr:alpha-N-arabinofuranosidase [Clostridiales bacterium]